MKFAEHFSSNHHTFWHKSTTTLIWSSNQKSRQYQEIAQFPDDEVSILWVLIHSFLQTQNVKSISPYRLTREYPTFTHEHMYGWNDWQNLHLSVTFSTMMNGLSLDGPNDIDIARTLPGAAKTTAMSANLLTYKSKLKILCVTTKTSLVTASKVKLCLFHWCSFPYSLINGNLTKIAYRHNTYPLKSMSVEKMIDDLLELQVI